MPVKKTRATSARKAKGKKPRAVKESAASSFPVELVTDQNYLRVLLRTLDRAKSKIDILSFSFAIGSTRGKLSGSGAPMVIANKLVELKQKKKLKIRLYIEGERETADRNSVTAEFLKKAGIIIQYGATHAKGFCIDDRLLLFGSTNLTNQSVAKNNEANLLIDSKKVASEFEAYFEHLWAGGRHGGIHLEPPLFADADFLRALVQIIDDAKKRIEFSIYFFDQDDIRDALIRAHQRGVKVTGFVHQHFSFGLSYIRRNFRTVKALKEAGITDLHFSRPHTFSHSKYIVSDRTTIAMGTGNWLDEDVEIHPQLYICFRNPALARELAKHVADQIKNRSAERLWSKPRPAERDDANPERRF